ncbi:hypothetical protein [Rhizobium sp. LCM 4573]|uniref:hypothetical protein n=1 Tax=Rhizobium sp. LCM 4573 TaxID=1848291 RepID=UPI0008DA9EA9|nr:hypothetical protein [Rhizobium sp. LCM 4573]OHV82577.1 hypothetical protein LCM4573_16385 [Rhizobium sp. LCM 4573]
MTPLLEASLPDLGVSESSEFRHLPPIPVVSVSLEALANGVLEADERTRSVWRYVVELNGDALLVDIDEEDQSTPSSILRGQVADYTIESLEAAEEFISSVGGDFHVEIIEVPEIHTIAVSLPNAREHWLFPILISGQPQPPQRRRLIDFVAGLSAIANLHLAGDLSTESKL